jgi:tRNA A-37 threonylcarbamoyl transferase component Bud32
MSLSNGTRLGPYQIEVPIGAGGMGEVYRAKDTRLDRTVAVKVLADKLSRKPGLRQRFEREARAIASLNHPHICALHDVGQQDGVDFLVMEYLEGETLADRLSHGALMPELLLRYAIQIADALDKAHRQAFVHRDLKPGNIMLTRTGVKLLDFGLAKFATDERALQAGATVGAASTLTMQPVTAEGTIVGTLQYMAPEQLEGREADPRTDLFAFGLVVYEMATGKKAFTGKSQASLMTAIMTTDPPAITSLQPASPPGLDRVVKTCLAKEPEDRWQTAHDVMLELKWIGESSTQAAVSTPAAARSRRRERWAWAAAGLLLIGLLALLPFTIAYLRQTPAEARRMIFPILPPDKASLGSIAVSPDGRWLAFTAATGGKNQLWVRALDALQALPLSGTEGATLPFWSPDSSFIGFSTGGKIKKIGVSGGPLQTVCDVAGARGGAWNHDGVIVFATAAFGLHQVSATGGDVTPVTTPDYSRQEAAHASPFFLPDGRHFLCYIHSGRKETRGIYIGSLEQPMKQRLLGADSNALYAAPGYLVFMREGMLLAQPFDVQQLKLAGEPFLIAERVGRDPNLAHGSFSISDNGVLVYDSSLNRQSKQLVWVDRHGNRIRSLGVVGGYGQPCLSPDEKRVAVDSLNDETDTNDIWLYDVAAGGGSRFTVDPASDLSPMWSPDGSRIIWRSNREGTYDLYWKATSGAGPEERLLKSAKTAIPTGWSQDGRFLIYYEIDPKTKRDLWVLPLFGDRKALPLSSDGVKRSSGPTLS